MVQIDILGGKNEIGGNKILVEHEGTRIILDFGMSFNQNSKYFSEFLQPRKCSALTDFFELGLLPDIKGIYRTDYLEHMGRQPEEREIDAVLLTHAHADHAQYIHFLRFDVPILCTKETKIILQCLEETGSNTFSDYIKACEAFKFYRNTKGSFSRVTKKQQDFLHKRNFHLMEPEKKLKIGSLEIEMVPVDHSLPGACGYIIYTSEGNLVYTGDIRFHGSNRQLSRKFVEKAKSVNPRWLICEGTRIDKQEIDSEDRVKEEITRFISKARGLAFVEHPIRDLDRVKSIFESARTNGRYFVVPLKAAYLIESLGNLCPFCLDDVKILVPRKSWGLIYKEGYEQDLINKDYDSWEQNYIHRSNSITCKELRQNPLNYVVSMSLWEINQLVDIQPQNAIWIKSSCEPFCEEMELDEERKQNWLDRFKIVKYSAHASGHASGLELIKMINEIKPDSVIPVHTEKPDLFKQAEAKIIVY
ncbi:MBL fold metallo-hydrolase [Methanosarcina sp. MSH10X1]|uniref:MBL fold metallo-hydrolase n=1 Tax=Methanosarcina sp. MSH10X1 TaxID=2507075 RepID=UPI000FFC9851|nr:MBL fold metallo-hydrolase [Methanosarcina sp. MSH10X1]RXA18485.1 MBL fold metallo-hydrolase [Methanosarcina sp. MSH10X1]